MDIPVNISGLGAIFHGSGIGATFKRKYKGQLVDGVYIGDANDSRFRRKEGGWSYIPPIS